MADEIGEIRSRIHIVDLVESSGTQLKRHGKNFLGLCPFHSDRKPSLNVNAELGRYKCFSCGEGGDIFTWVMKTQNLDFLDALRFLAQKAGVQLKAGQKRDPVDKSARKRRLEAMEAALAFFRAELKKSPVAKSYCNERSISDPEIDFWELGYSPDSGDLLANSLARNGFRLQEAQDLFLVSGSEQEGYRDRFRGRLMFPIRDEKGDLVAFGGRLISQIADAPKYVNSSDTPLYNKSSVLYGLFASRGDLIKSRRVILAEGYMDVLACHRAGLTTAMASLGTSLTSEQANLLKRWCDSVVVLYDGDSAGIKASIRAGEILEQVGLKVVLSALPAGEDPDTLLKSQGAAALDAVVQSGYSVIDFKVRDLENRFGKDQPEFWELVTDVLSESKSELEMTRQTDRLAGAYPGVRDVREARVALKRDVMARRSARKKAALARGKNVSATPAPSQPSEAIKADPKLHPMEQAYLHAYFDAEQREELHEKFVRGDWFFTSDGRAIEAAIVDKLGSSPPEGPALEWIHLLDTFADWPLILKLDRFGPSSGEFALDAISKLEKARNERRMKKEEDDLPSEGGGDDRLRKVHERLRAHKPDPRDLRTGEE